jgi:hypothetical protein
MACLHKFNMFRKCFMHLASQVNKAWCKLSNLSCQHPCERVDTKECQEDRRVRGYRRYGPWKDRCWITLSPPESRLVARFQDASRCFKSRCQRLQPLVAPVTHRNTLFSFVQSVQLLGVLGGWYVCVAKSHSTIILFVRL